MDGSVASRPTKRRYETPTPEGRDQHVEVREMTPRPRLVMPMLVGIGLLALTGGTSIAFNPFLCCRSGPTVTEAISQVPLIPAGMARVWFLRQFEPTESLASPMISANGAPVGLSEPGTAFIRDFDREPTPSRCRAMGSIAARRQPFSSFRGRRPISRSSRCAAGRILAKKASETLSMYGPFRRIGPKNISPR